MLQGLILLIALQIIGDWISHALDIPIPGSIIGMLLLLCFLIIKGSVSKPLAETAQSLFPYLPLLLIPASVGVIQYGELLQVEGFAVISALVISAVASLIAVPFIFKFLKSVFNR